MTGGRFEHSTDVAADGWIAPRLGGEFGAVDERDRLRLDRRGGSRALVDRVLASDLETAEVDQTSDLSWEGDLVNPSAPTA